jgi:hypothetical protein
MMVKTEQLCFIDKELFLQRMPQTVFLDMPGSPYGLTLSKEAKSPALSANIFHQIFLRGQPGK